MSLWSRVLIDAYAGQRELDRRRREGVSMRAEWREAQTSCHRSENSDQSSRLRHSTMTGVLHQFNAPGYIRVVRAQRKARPRPNAGFSSWSSRDHWALRDPEPCPYPVPEPASLRPIDAATQEFHALTSRSRCPTPDSWFPPRRIGGEWSRHDRGDRRYLDRGLQRPIQRKRFRRGAHADSWRDCRLASAHHRSGGP